MDRDGDARDVAHADRRGERGRERLEVRHVAGLVRVVVPARRDGESVAEAPELDESQADREEEPGSEQEDDQGDREPVSNGGDDEFKKLHEEGRGVERA